MKRSQGDLLVLCEEAQTKAGYLSPELMTELAKSLDIPLSEVYGVASFYTFLSTKPQGRHVIRVCKSLPCLLKNAEVIIKGVADELGIRPGETTPDGRFSLALANCIGACDQAPAMMVDYDVHGDLTPRKIARGEMPEVVGLVHRVMDGDKPDLSSLSQKEVNYVRTVRVLTGQSLYSHSWLEI